MTKKNNKKKNTIDIIDVKHSTVIPSMTMEEEEKETISRQHNASKEDYDNRIYMIRVQFQQYLESKGIFRLKQTPSERLAFLDLFS